MIHIRASSLYFKYNNLYQVTNTGQNKAALRTSSITGFFLSLSCSKQQTSYTQFMVLPSSKATAIIAAHTHREDVKRTIWHTVCLEYLCASNCR